jgi:hypothetical protein
LVVILGFAVVLTIGMHGGYRRGMGQS